MKRILFLVIVCAAQTFSLAQKQVTIDNILQVANFALADAKQLSILEAIPSIDSVYTLTIDGKNVLYEVVYSSHDVLLFSGSKVTVPILAHYNNFYGSTLLAQRDNQDPRWCFAEWYVGQIINSLDGSCDTLPDHEDWNKLLNRQTLRDQQDYVEPLVTSHWGQDISNDYTDCHAYNCLVSSTLSSCTCNQDASYCPAGCAAVALGQIMNYWKYPVWLPNQPYQYDWCNMKDMLVSNTYNYEREKAAIGRLLYDCGVKSNMQYCYQNSCVSAALNDSVRIALVNSFSYHNEAKLIHMNDLGSGQWVRKIRQEVSNNRPVYYCAQTLTGEAHAFVCDGYDLASRFHFNFGWNGRGDGYYYLDSLYPQNNSHYMSFFHHAIIKIHPAYTQDYCDFNLPLWMHYYNYYTLLGDTIPDPHLNVPKTFTTLTSVPLDNAYPATWRTIPTGESSEYVAHKEVVLQAGFTAEAGCTFVARIEPCASCEEGDGFRRRPLPYKPEMMDKNIVETFHGTSPQDGTAGGLLVYPNPTDGTVTVEAKGDSPIRNVTVLDMSGRVMDGVLHTPQSENSYICTLNLQHLESGIYLIRALTADGKTVSGKVVKN